MGQSNPKALNLKVQRLREAYEEYKSYLMKHLPPLFEVEAIDDVINCRKKGDVETGILVYEGKKYRYTIDSKNKELVPVESKPKKSK